MKDKPSIQVIERMASLLDVIAANDRAVSLKVLSAETGLHPSTAFRILASLGEQGFVARDGAACYRLGTKLLQLGSRVQSRIDLRGEAREILEDLRSKVGETANLVIRQGDEVVYLDRATTSRMMRVEQIVGSRAPLHVTAVGKLMLSESGTDACQQYAERTGLPAYTPNTLTDLDKLIQAIADASKDGFAVDNEEAERGVGCIGVLVRDSSTAVAAGVSISFPIERFSDDWIPYVIDAGQRLSARLGYVPPSASRARTSKRDEYRTPDH